MVSITVTRGGVSRILVWENGEIAGDEMLTGAVAAMEQAGTQVLLTPVGPLIPVDRGEVRTLLAAFAEDPDAQVSYSGVLPRPTWETGETDGLDVDF